MKILHSVTASTNSAKYTIKSVSDEGTYYLVKDWRKNKELWVSKEKMDRHPEWWFTSSGKAKQSLKSLLSVMDEYLSDTFTVVDMSGNETPLDVKKLGFDHIPEYWDDDIDACDKVISSTRYKANMVSADTDIDEDFDPKYDCKYHANSYYGTNYSGLEDDFHTDDPSELMSWVWDHATEGGYVEISGPKGSVRLDPDELAERVEFGDIGEYEIISQIDYV
jgi:hypothetical protein